MTAKDRNQYLDILKVWGPNFLMWMHQKKIFLETLNINEASKKTSILFKYF